MRVTDTHVYFYTNEFSNWWSTKNIVPQFTDPVSGVVWNNTEEAFMWYKAFFFEDRTICSEIVKHAAARKHPSEVKVLGRLVKGYDDKRWGAARLGYMTYVNLLKYQQNPDLCSLLLDTDDRILVEASPVDRIWGVGLGEKDDRILDEKNWLGQNLLGKALINVRKQLK